MDYKVLRKYSALYGLIVLTANVLAVILPQVFDTKTGTSHNSMMWHEFIEAHAFLNNTLTVIFFIIPFILCVKYIFPRDDEKLKERFINTPLAYGFIGSLGWLLDMLASFILIAYAGNTLHFNIAGVVVHKMLFSLLSAFLTFTISFFAIQYIHRKFILPKYFSEGHFSNYKCLIKPSFKLLSHLVYITSAGFPLIVLLALFFSIYNKNPLPGYSSKFVLVLILIFTGFVINHSFMNYFEIPIKKLKEGADNIKNGNYSHKIDFVSNDDLGELTDAFNDMNKAIVEKNEKIASIQNSIIKGMATMVESRDNSTGGHINRTSAYVQLFAKHLYESGKYPSITEDFINNVMKAAPMHDLGKIAVDDEILRKPGKFTDEEYEKMKAHASEGARIVSSVLSEVDNQEFKQIAINVAHYHHEKWNGTGYPEKISGNEIPLEARIMALADVYDALVSKRCYKDQFSFDKAFSIIQESSGTHFDPDLAEQFLECRAELEELTCMLSE